MITNTHWSLASFRKQVKQRAETVRNRRKKKIANLVDLSNNQNKRSSDMANSFWSSGSVLNSPLNLTNGTKNSKTVKSPKTVTIQPKPEDIPSFSDFLEFILSTDLLGTGFSSHWVPYWRQCTPCHFDYSGTRSSTRQIQINLLWIIMHLPFLLSNRVLVNILLKEDVKNIRSDLFLICWLSHSYWACG